jgi:hypothetical protein
MQETLLALKHLVSPEQPPSHGDFEHLHWNRETRTWLPHDAPEQGSAAA